MKIKNKKGFTLLELLVVMIIFTTIIFLGYQVINKSQSFSSKQHKVNDIQLGVNNLKKYLTEDLKKCNSVDLLNTNTESNYSYKINMDDSEANEVIYEVKYKTKGDKKYYSINRVSSKEKMVLVDNQYTKTNKSDDKLVQPLIIDTSKNPYKVTVNYGSLDTELYTFDVYNEGMQLAGGTLKPPYDPDEDPDFIEKPGNITFGFKDNGMQTTAGPIGKNENNPHNKPDSGVITTESNRWHVEATITPGNGNGQANTKMFECKSEDNKHDKCNEVNKIESSVHQSEPFKDHIDYTKIVIEGKLKLTNLIIKASYGGNTSNHIIQEEAIDKDFSENIPKKDKKLAEIKVSGILEKNSEKGKITIVFGKKK